MRGPHNEPVIFQRDCDAVMIPGGDTGTIPMGAEGVLTQALGGSFTVYIQGNLFRIAGVDADAIGKEVPEPPTLPENATEKDVEDLIWAQIATCYDPEIPINIVELGLVYECNITPLGFDERQVDIKMTLTAPGCGMGDVLADDVRDKVLMVPTVVQTSVEIVFDPPWNYDMMSEAAKLQTGLL
ncbi:putative Fe-S cluster assembly protein SufT [Alkalilimnicola ehrlichii]|uniref:Putative Fe-S cluster assembly protein SufT n=1 Tax=Alkalilimnicola ehrlichii TaxID=351052 RepID=A0A3E0WUB8_9GAMM|nr:putative Fe-S cluster assembly protein SufT [Alkalilimnicola ehrlichii]RFA36428.1 putative Fe-S cluster assembly protein SufT [Alkalilimnicola ehrlichii]